MRLAYVTGLRVKGKPKTLVNSAIKEHAAKYCQWEIIFIGWTVSFSATPPTLSSPCLLFITYGFVPTDVNEIYTVRYHMK